MEVRDMDGVPLLAIGGYAQACGPSLRGYVIHSALVIVLSLISMRPSTPQNVDLVKLRFKKVTQNSHGDIKSEFVFRLIGPLIR